MKITVAIVFTCCAHFIKSQNLIQNPSFEITTPPLNCSMANFSQVNFWKDLGSADLFSLACPNSFFSVSLPFNWSGNIYPKDGNNITGIGMSSDFNIGREYVYQKLKFPLKKNYIYCMEYFLSKADNCEWAIRDIDALFTENEPNIDSNTFKLIATPQIVNHTGIITDTTNWILVTDTFIAKGNEQYVTIGNFTESSSVLYSNPGTLNPNTLSNRVYVYIDKISLIVCDSIINEENNIIENLTLPNVFTPNGDGTNDAFSFTLKNGTVKTFAVYNRWGNIIYMMDKNSSPSGRLGGAWDGRTTAGEPCNDGVYFYVLEYTDARGELKTKRGYVSLMR